MLAAVVAMGAATFSTHAATLTADDYCDVKIAAPASIKEMHPMADGLSYAAISDDGKRIEVFSYKNGNKTATLFDVDAVKGDLKISEFDGYELTSNEKKILLWNNTQKIYRHSFRAEYYVYDIMRSTLKRVSTQGPQQCATLSHDGRMVAYQRDNNIFISNLDYDTDRAITTDGRPNAIINGTADWGYEEEFGVINTMRWSADDNTLAFIRFDETDVPTYTFDDYRSYCDSREADSVGAARSQQPGAARSQQSSSNTGASDFYPAQFTYKYPLAGCNNSRVSVLTYDLNNRVTKKMQLPVEDTDYIPSLEFDGKGTTLMVMILNRDQNLLRLFTANPGSTVCRQILTEKSDAWLSPSAYQMVDYGADSFIIASERSGWRHLYKYDYNGTLVRQLTKGDFNITAYYGTDARGTLFAQTTALGAQNRNVAAFPAKGEMRLLNDKTGFEAAAFSRNMAYWVRTYSNTTTPQQYTICQADGKTVTKLELNEEYAAKYASAPKMELLQVPNAEGELMNAYIIKPADFDANRKYPLVMYQYNGPDSQEVVNRWRMEGIFYLASQGYIVAAVDGRGTGNRSRQWATAVYKKLGQFETADQLAGARYFSSLPYVDAQRTACFGWSYGGYMTLMELSSKQSTFKAGVSMAPVTDWRFYDSIYTERYMLTPQQNASGYDAASALNRTQDLHGRLLIMSGTNDDNVHFYNTLTYTSKLNYEGTIFDMMAYSGFEHSLRMCNARARLFVKIADFLSREL